MALKSPGILTFMISVILTVLALVTYFFAASIPFITGQEFWVLLVAQIVLDLRLHHARPLDCAAIAKSQPLRAGARRPCCRIAASLGVQCALVSRDARHPGISALTRAKCPHDNADIAVGHLARRVRRSAREIILAVVLTLAAAAFVIAAVSGSTPETAAVIDAARSRTTSRTSPAR